MIEEAKTIGGMKTIEVHTFEEFVEAQEELQAMGYIPYAVTGQYDWFFKGEGHGTRYIRIFTNW